MKNITISAQGIIAGKSDWELTEAAKDVFRIKNSEGNEIIVSTFDLEPFNDTATAPVPHLSGQVEDALWYELLEWVDFNNLFTKEFLCVWGSGYTNAGEPAFTENHDRSWFTEELGYTPIYQQKLDLLRVGESADFSEILSVHSVTRIS